MKVVAYAAYEPHGRLEPLEYEAGPLGPDEVDVAVTHCGVCHSDVSLIDNEYGFCKYPLVVGHEGVGVVAAVGANVDPTRLRVGQRVAIGAISGACMQCEYCVGGRHNLCARRDDTLLRGQRGHSPPMFAPAIGTSPIRSPTESHRNTPRPSCARE